MKNILLRYLGANLVVYIIYFAFFTLVGPVTYYYLGDDFWTQSWILTAISAILGFLLFIVLFTGIYMLIFSLNPYSKLVNIIQVINLVLLIVLLDVILPERTYISMDLQFRGFIVIGSLILVLQLIAYFKVRTANMRVVENEYKYYLQTHKLKEPISNEVLTFNVSYIMAGFMAVSIFTNEIGSWITFVLVFIYNAYFVYRWMFIINASKRRKILSGFFSLILYALSIGLFYLFNEFTNTHSIVRALLITLPILIYLPRVMRYHHIAEWSSHIKMNKE